MHAQATSLDVRDRRRAVDRVQQIVADQQPFIYLVYPNTLYAVSPQLGGVQPSVLQPGLVWNIDTIRPKGARQ
jgi:peptide/nickel transport system substrate-binding protein